MRTAIVLAALALACQVLPSRLMAAEVIQGRVSESGKDSVKIATDSEWLPAIGDRVRIYFEMPGADEGVTVAEGRVTETAGGVIVAGVERAATKVELGHLATILSAKPQKRAPARAPEAPPGGASLPAIGATMAVEVGKASPLAEGNALYGKRDFAGARRAYERVAAQQPNNVEVHLALGRTHNWLGDLDASIAAYERALRLAPQTPCVRGWIGEMFLHKGDYQAAARWLNEEIAGCPKNAWAHACMGTLGLMTGDAGTRDRGFRTAISIDPKVVMNRCNNGSFLMNERQYGRALIEFTSAAYMDPSASAEASYGAAQCSAELGRKAPAIQWYERYLQLDGTSERAARARAELQRLRQP